MHEIWLIGIAAGIGTAIGLAAGGALARSDRAPFLAAAVALVGGGLIGSLVFDWKAGLVGAIAGVLSGFGAGTFARGAREARRKLPAEPRSSSSEPPCSPWRSPSSRSVGFVEAIAIPVVGLRSRQRAGEKYAGLRTLAK